MKKQKVKCIEYTVKNNNQGMYAIYTTPIAYIVKEYGSVDYFLEQRQEGHEFKIQEVKETLSNDYTDGYSEYVNNHNDYIIKAIESVKQGNIKDKKEVVKYLQSLI